MLSRNLKNDGWRFLTGLRGRRPKLGRPTRRGPKPRPSRERRWKKRINLNRFSSGRNRMSVMTRKDSWCSDFSFFQTEKRKSGTLKPRKVLAPTELIRRPDAREGSFNSKCWEKI